MASKFSEPAAAAFWLRRARWLRWKLNAGCVCAAVLPSSLAVLLAAVCALLLARQWRAPAQWVWWGAALAWVAVAGIGYHRARRSFFTPAEALARLDADLGLFNRLTASQAGVAAAWPAPPEQWRPAMRWSLPRTLLPVLVGLGLLIAAALLPPMPFKPLTAYAMAAPAAWDQVQMSLDQLEQEEVVQEEALERLKEQLEALRSQPQEQWYSHSSLEAGDNLRRQLGESLRGLQRDLNQAGRLADGLQQGSAGDKSAAAEKLADALRQLGQGGMAIDPKMLGGIDPSQLQELSDAQLQELQERLEKASKVCSTCLGNGEIGADGFGAGTEPGRGGIARGPGTAPLTLSMDETQLDGQRVEGMANTDFSRARLGDVVSESSAAPENDLQPFRPAASGGAAAAGSGGEAVWKETFVPAEREVLQRYFK